MKIQLGNSRFDDGCMKLPIANFSLKESAEFNCETNSYEQKCQTSCKNNLVNELARMEVDKGNVVSLYHFWLLLIFMIIAWDGQSVVVSVGDTICFVLLGKLWYNYVSVQYSLVSIKRS